MTSANQGCCLMSARSPEVPKIGPQVMTGDQNFNQGAQQGHLKLMILRLAFGE